MSFELSGKLVEILDTVQVNDRFKKREFVVLKEENKGGTVFSDTIKFQLTQDRVALMDGYKPNDEVKVVFNIRGNKWERDGKVNYFNNLDVWKVEPLSTQEEPPPFDDAPWPDEEPGATQEGEDDLPF